MDYLRFPDLNELRCRGTAKWTQFSEDVLPMFVAESDFGTCPEIKAALAEAVEKECFGYPPERIDALANSFSGFVQRRYNWQVNPDHVFAVADVVRALSLSLQYLVGEDATYAFATPAYAPFFNLGKRYITTDSLTLEGVEECFKQGAQCFVLCNPHNPLGATYSREFLVELAELAQRYNARILSDEIHAPLTLQGSHIPAASVSATAAEVTITAMAASKAWNVAGLKCAQLVLTNAADRERFAALPSTVTDGVSTLGLIASTAAYAADERFLDAQIAHIVRMQERVRADLTRLFPGVRFSPASATYLLWADFSDATDASGTPIASPYEWFLARKIAVSPGVSFGAAYGHCVRLNLAISEATWEEALRRMQTVL